MDSEDLKSLVSDLGFSKIREVVGSSDTNIMICCPCHDERNPSCGISAEKEVFNCYGCGKTGGIVELVSYMKEISFRKAKEYLEERFNVRKKSISSNRKTIKRYGDESRTEELSERDSGTVLPMFALAPYKSGKVCHDYLLRRGFSKPICRTFKLGWDSSRCRITIPIFNRKGNLLGFLARTVLEKGERGYKKLYGDTDKYLVDNFKRSLTLFPVNLFPAYEVDTAIIVEGSLDAMWMHQQGFTNTLALLTSKISKEQIKLLHSLHIRKIIFMLDNDKAGIDGTLLAYKKMKNDFICYKVEYPNGKNDPQNCTKEEIAEMLENMCFFNLINVKKLQ